MGVGVDSGGYSVMFEYMVGWVNIKWKMMDAYNVDEYMFHRWRVTAGRIERWADA